MKNYLNVESLVSDIFGIYKKAVEDYLKGESLYVIDHIEENYDDDFLHEYAWRKAIELNSNMNVYLHSADKKLCGNFNNIEYDLQSELYAASGGKYGVDEIDYNSGLLKNVVETLDNGEESEFAYYCRNAMTSWFWSTFGTFGIDYEFRSALSDEIYSLEAR